MIYFISFGDSLNYSKNKERICTQAKSFNLFDNIIWYDESMLDDVFLKKHQKFITTNKRGFGYWLWKPQIIKQTLNQMNNNDILIYADSGCSLFSTGIERLKQYIDYVNKYEVGNLSFQLNDFCTEKKFNKRKLIDKYNYVSDKTIVLEQANKDNVSNQQLMATVFILRKCDFTTQLVDKWLEECEIYSNIDDSNTDDNYKEFIDHRHDQAIFSLVRKSMGTIIIQDDTYLGYPNWYSRMDIPIHATRIK